MPDCYTGMDVEKEKRELRRQIMRCEQLLRELVDSSDALTRELMREHLGMLERQLRDLKN
jgi:hypothetical protein